VKFFECAAVALLAQAAFAQSGDMLTKNLREGLQLRAVWQPGPGDGFRGIPDETVLYLQDPKTGDLTASKNERGVWKCYQVNTR
jgi:hypothetical protein